MDDTWVGMDGRWMRVLPTVALGQQCEGGRHSWGASPATALSFPFLLGACCLSAPLFSSPQSRSIRGGRYAPHNLSRGLLGHRTRIAQENSPPRLFPCAICSALASCEAVEGKCCRNLVSAHRLANSARKGRAGDFPES